MRSYNLQNYYPQRRNQYIQEYHVHLISLSFDPFYRHPSKKNHYNKLMIPAKQQLCCICHQQFYINFYNSNKILNPTAMNTPNRGNRSPVRSRICLRNSKMINRQPALIPQIRIELDDMLDDAYKQLRNQPKKNIILGHPTDICIIDNNILKDYVHAIYSEYNIIDPMNPEYQKLGYKSRSKSISVNSSGSKNYITPKKSMKMADKSDRHMTKPRKSNLAKLKMDIRKQLSEQQVLKIDQMRPITLKSMHEDSELEGRKFPITKPKLKVKLNRSRRNKAESLKQSQANSIDYSQHHAASYCLFCDHRLDKNIKQHSQQCSQLKNFIDVYPNPTLSILTEGVSIKISQLNEQILSQSNSLKVSAYSLQQAIRQYIDNPSENDDSFDISSPIQKFRSEFSPLLGQRPKNIQILEMYRESVIMRCYKQLEYLQYLKRVRKQLIQAQEVMNYNEDEFTRRKIGTQVGQKYIGYPCTL